MEGVGGSPGSRRTWAPTKGAAIAPWGAGGSPARTPTGATGLCQQLPHISMSVIPDDGRRSSPCVLPVHARRAGRVCPTLAQALREAGGRAGNPPVPEELTFHCGAAGRAGGQNTHRQMTAWTPGRGGVVPCGQPALDAAGQAGLGDP